MDFAGGVAVHATAGTAALVTALTLSKSRGFPKYYPTTQSNLNYDRSFNVMEWMVRF